MTKEEIKDLVDWINSLEEGDEKRGAIEALQAILAARDDGGGGGGMPPPPTTPLDPKLKRPEMKKRPPSDPDLEIEDPEDLMKELDKEVEDEESDASDEESEDKGESGDGDGEGDDEEETVDDDDIDLPDSVAKDPTEEDKKKKEIFRRQVELANAAKQIKRAKKKIESGEVSATAAQKAKLDEYLEEITKKLEDLKSDPDSVKKESASDFNARISEMLDAADELGIRHIKIDDMGSRIKKIKDSTEDSLANADLDDEDAANRNKDPEFQKMKAAEREKDRIRKERERLAKEGSMSTFKGDLETFKADLKRAIGDQINDMLEVEEETYARFNRHHEYDDMALPGVRIYEIPDSNKPSIDVYFDQSGSWGDDEVRRGLAAIADLLSLEDQNLLNLEIYYFSEILSQDQDAARRRGARECWDLIIDNINAAPKTKNVIIMTDSDIGYDYRSPGQHGCINGSGTSVEGCVWFLWKKGSRVAAAPRKLFGKKGTFEYSI
jgi:hypothetical protein